MIKIRIYRTRDTKSLKDYNLKNKNKKGSHVVVLPACTAEGVRSTVLHPLKAVMQCCASASV